ncbi:hypothetical protein Sjap_006958 [Stephania japonica]|uniref:UspA domain-containing protein n=1 Tax=Stephania japonica TaxID=461633 RepID=A0AAP0PMF7_9MAGN
MSGGDRRVGVAMDFSKYSKRALRWAADNVLRDRDHLILLNVRPHSYEGGEMQLWETTGSRCSSLKARVNRKQKSPRNWDANITVLMKIFWGDAREKICQAIRDIPLSCIVMGSRGLGKIERVFLGSVSDYVVDTATCPVIVVKNVDEER